MLKPKMKLLVVGLLAASLLAPQAVFAKGTAPTSAPAPAKSSSAPVASSPERTLAYHDQWITIKPGEWQWYAFKYSFDNTKKRTTNHSDSKRSNNQFVQLPSTIRLDAKPANGVTLTLLNSDQVRAWEHGDKLAGFGAATAPLQRVQQKAKIGDFCKNYPDDAICNGGSRATSMCENLRDPARTGDACHYFTHEPLDYATWSGVIDASGTYYILVRANPNLTGPIQYKFTASGEGFSMK